MFVAFLDRATKEHIVDKVVRVIVCLAVVGCGLCGVAEADPPSVPASFICMYGHSDDLSATDQFRKIIPPFTVIEGTSADADFIQELIPSYKPEFAELREAVAACVAKRA